MLNDKLSFDDLPQVVAELRDEVIGMKVLLSDLQKGQTQQKIQRVRRTMNVEEAADYLRMPLNTLYMKLQKGEVQDRSLASVGSCSMTNSTSGWR